METPSERTARTEENLRKLQEASAAEEEELDERVRRNIEQYGA